jgi:prepilin-type N-terminal cleavage/methylation domain-containing protein
MRRVLADRWRRARGGAADSAADAGLSLVEMLVAMSIVTVAVLGLLGELAADIKQQFTEKTQTTAVHLASSELESARNLSYDRLLSLLGTTTDPPITLGGVSYTRTTTLEVCAATDGLSTCTTPASGAAKTARATVEVTWTSNGTTHSVHMVRNLTDDAVQTLTNGVSPLGSCGGSGTTLVTGSLSLSPSTVTVDSSGHASSNVTVTLTETGLANATCVPLTWSDDNGAHQLSMTGGSGTYSVSVPSSSITKSAATSGASVAFTATVPGSQAVPSASLTIQGQPAFSGNCSVSVAGLALNTITINPLTRKSLLGATVTCTTTNLSKTDTVKATYASGTSGNTQTLSLSSSDGNSWTGTIPAGTTMASSGSAEAFSFSLKRASDNATASQSLTVALA